MMITCDMIGVGDPARRSYGSAELLLALQSVLKKVEIGSKFGYLADITSNDWNQTMALEIDLIA